MKLRPAAIAIALTMIGLVGTQPAQAHQCPYTTAEPLVLPAGSDTYYVTCTAEFHRWQGYDSVPNLFAHAALWKETNGTPGLQPYGETPDSAVEGHGIQLEPFCPGVWYVPDFWVNALLEGVCWTIPEL